MKPPLRAGDLARSMAGVSAAEPVILAIRPSLWIIITDQWRRLAALAIAGILLFWLTPAVNVLWYNRLIGVLLVVAVVWLVLAFWSWSVRLYVLTPARVIAVSGVLRRVIVEAPLARLQQITVVKTASERTVAVGTVIVETAGSGLGVVELFGVPRPERIASIVRAAARQREGRGRSSDALGDVEASGVARVSNGTIKHDPGKHHPGVLVLGLAGGIGAGKSAVAAALARLGCVVVDSDLESRAALDRPDVRARLTQWWGEGVLDAGGMIDRKKVAEIVFRDPDQRRRLEELVHPIVRQNRAGIVKRAAASGAGVVVVDAPLLFEAGVDKECDAVIFVDAPLEVRARRVQETRGWTLEELERREGAQLATEEKRRRSRYVIANHGAAGELEALAGRVLRQARADFGLSGG